MSRSPEQIAIIGAGSHIFTANVFRDLCYTPGLEGSNVILQDVNRDRLENITTVCGRYARELGVDLRVESVSERTDAIRNSSFVVNTALAGGRESVERTKKAVSEATGIYGPIEAHAPYRQLKLMLDIARDVAKLSPDATLIQCANPMPEGGTLIERETGIRFIGVCHGYKEYEHLARLLGMNPDLVDAQIAGINHNVWLLDLKYEGVDAYPRLDEWFDIVSKHFYNYFLPHAKNVDYQLSRAAADMYRHFGLMPIGDTTRASTPEMWWYHTSQEVEEAWYGREKGFESKTGVASNLRWREDTQKAISEAASGKGSVRRIFPNHESGWQIVPIMDSVANDALSTQQVNVPNRGAIVGLPDDFVVEVPAIIDGNGVRRLDPITIPPKVMLGAIIPRWLQAERHVNAFRTGDDRFLFQQLMAVNKIRTPEQAEKIIEIWKELDPDMAIHYSGSQNHHN